MYYKVIVYLLQSHHDWIRVNVLFAYVFILHFNTTSAGICRNYNKQISSWDIF